VLLTLRRSTLAALLGAALICLSSASLEAQAKKGKGKNPPFLVGASSANADPDSTLCLGGYGSFCTRPMSGVKDPLTSSAIAITGADADTVIIAKATAVGLFASYKPEQGATGIYDIRQRIAAETGVPAGDVVVTSDHSHAAPDTIGIWGGVDRAYMEKLANSIVDASVGAFRARKPAVLSVASVDGPQLQSSYSTAPTNDEAMDDEFRVLFAETPKGAPIATLVNYAPHATVCGDCSDMASGDWTAWAAQEIGRRGLGTGIGFVGALGATDWRKTGEQDEREAEARNRINSLLDAAVAQKTRVTGNEVGADVVFINEQLMQPVLLANLLPAGVLNYGEGDIRIDRDTRAPFFSGGTIGTYVGAIRIGDVFISTFPGEPFPQLQDAFRDGGVEASEHFLLGGANDFLGYMVANDEQYQQSFEEGLTFLGGCPEEAVTHQLPGEHDGACPDHWTLMVSPTMGSHGVCTIQDAADRLGFSTGLRDERCEILTLRDGQNAPAEHPGSGA
jgi:hypothetical protein